MQLPSPEEFSALLRTDFNCFVERCFVELEGHEAYCENFHIAVLCSELLAMQRGDTQRLAIALPPRSLKSIVVSIGFVAWLLGHNPALKIICASYGQTLSEKLAKDCRQVMTSDWYKRLFPGTRFRNARPALNDLATTAGGGRRATTVGGSITGLGADYFIVDDPTKPEEAVSDVERVKVNAWGHHTLLTRLNNKMTSRIIIVMQRLHEDDLYGHMSALIKMKQIAFPAIAEKTEYHVILTPFGARCHTRLEGQALHPVREPLEVLEENRAAIGEQHFSAQYQQMPAPPGGSLVNPAWFPRFDLVNPPKFDQVMQSWDTASKVSERSDYSVCTTWGRIDKRFFLLHVLRKRLEYPDLKRAVTEQARLFDARTVLIEDSAAGIALIQELKRDGFYKAHAVKPKGDKFTRLKAQTAIMEAGLVLLPDQAPWLDVYLHELRMFPASRYDDQADSTSQALAHALTGVPGQGFIEWMEAELKADQPTIRVNHLDRGMQFGLSSGRTAIREADGSFIVNGEEWAGICSVRGIYRMDM